MELRETLTCALACVMFTAGAIDLARINTPLWQVFILVGVAVASAFGAGWGFSKIINRSDKK